MKRIKENRLDPLEHIRAAKKAFGGNGTQKDRELFLSSFKPRLGWNANAVVTQLAEAYLAVGPPPERIRGLTEHASYQCSGFTISPFHVILWRYRLPILVKDRGLEMDGLEGKYFSDSVYAVDLDDYTPAASDEGESYVYCPQEDYVIETFFYASSHHYVVQIYTGPNCKRSAKSIYKELHEAITKPNPYEGRIIAFHPKTGAELIPTREEKLSSYADDVEQSVAWAMSVFDDSIAQRLGERGLSKKNGVLLEGPPGSGKTTLVRRLAREGEGEITTIYINPGTPITDAMKFAKEFTKPLVVLEDVESHFGDRGEGDFSTFLNAIDGVSNDQIMVVIATTNDSSGFDPAIVRPGRLEERVKITSIHPAAILSMVLERFDGEERETLDRLIPILQDRAERDGGGFLTPAIIDGLARRAIIMGLSGEKLLSYAANDWILSTHGDTYLAKQESEDDSPAFDPAILFH